MKSFIQATFSGILASGALSNLTPIPLEFSQTMWNVANAALREYPPIGSSTGASPNTPNDRIIECFGTYLYREPLLLTHRGINGPKGRLIGLTNPVARLRIETLASAAVKLDNAKSVTNLLTAIRDIRLNLPKYLP
jgi:chitinase